MFQEEKKDDLQASINNEEDKTLNEEVSESLEEIEKEEEKSKAYKTLLAQKKHFQEKAKKLQAELEAKKTPEEPEKKPEAEKEEPKAKETDLEAFKKEVVIQTQKNLSDEEMSYLKKVSTIDNISLEDAYNSDFFKNYLQTKRQEQQGSQAIPAPTGRSSFTPTGNKEFENVWNSPDRSELVRNMDEDKRKEYEKFVANRLKQNIRR